MIDQQEHLKTVIRQRQQILIELQDLNAEVTLKRETLLKLQGIFEYLTGIGIKLPEEPSAPEAVTSEVIEK